MRWLLLIGIALAGLWLGGFPIVTEGVQRIVETVPGLANLPARGLDAGAGVIEASRTWFGESNMLVKLLVGAPVALVALTIGLFALGLTIALIAWIYRSILSMVIWLRDAWD